MLGSLVLLRSSLRFRQALRIPTAGGCLITVPIILSLFCVFSPAAAQVSVDYSIRMSDGIFLEATVTTPAGTPLTAGFPGVVFIHGYGGNKEQYAPIATYLAAQGYAALLYSVRGQGNSGGLSTTMGDRERQDLREVIQFFRTVPCVDTSRIGVAGGSQGGIHAWMAATQNMPGVAVAASLIGPPSFALDLIPADCLKQQLCAELTLQAVRYDPQRDRLRDFIIAEQIDSVHALVATRDLEHLLDSVRIPVIQLLGWADALFPVNGALRALQRLSTRGVPVWSYFGTNGHGEPVHLGETFFTLAMMTNWFDRWLKGSPLARATEPYVVFADDREGWPHHETIGWPPEPQGTVRLFFSGTSLRSSPPASSYEAPFQIHYDAAYSAAQAWNEAYGTPAFRDAFRSTPARFLSDPLADTLDVTGIPRARLQLKSAGPRFQANVRVFDVSPADGGFAWRLITRGANGVRGYIPGTVSGRDVECQALSHRVPPGHRIGVELTSLDMYDATRAHIIPYFLTTNSALVGTPSSPSYIDLPLVGHAMFASVATPAATRPASMMLNQNYPNPFNPATTIRFSLAATSHVRLEVFSLQGQRIAVLLDGSCEPGDYAMPFDGQRLASGMYVYRLSSGNASMERKMLLVR